MSGRMQWRRHTLIVSYPNPSCFWYMQEEKKRMQWAWTRQAGALPGWGVASVLEHCDWFHTDRREWKQEQQSLKRGPGRAVDPGRSAPCEHSLACKETNRALTQEEQWRQHHSHLHLEPKCLGLRNSDSKSVSFMCCSSDPAQFTGYELSPIWSAPFLHS